ncbi:MAG: radical SAM protein [Mogibacterium sp.]|nr:radical SAM protein [Mogibacterium sp.]
MDYEGQICRAPMERAAYKLPVMVGCCYNQCRFCDLFKHLKFRIIPIEEVEADIRRVSEAGGSPRKIFLGDGSAFALRTDYLINILDLIHKYFPQCNEINMNATVTSILEKSDEELQILAENGVKHLYIGLESGLEDVLGFMNKGNTVEQLIEAVKRIRRYGMCFDAHIMTGAAGHGRGPENAAATARILTELGASSATNFSMFIHYETPLYEDMQLDRFTAASEYENLIEDRELIRLICEELGKTGGQSMKYEGFHDFISFHVWGTLPRDGDKMMSKLDKVISEYAERQDVLSVIHPDSTFEIRSAY